MLELGVIEARVPTRTPRMPERPSGSAEGEARSITTASPGGFGPVNSASPSDQPPNAPRAARRDFGYMKAAATFLTACSLMPSRRLTARSLPS